MKKFLAIILCASLILTACSTNNDKKRKHKKDREERNEVVEKTEEEVTSEETSALSETSEITIETTAEPVDETDYSYEEAYLEVIENYRASSDFTGEIKYNLIFVDDDSIPELVIDCTSYYVSLYTYADGEVYQVMSEWGYGAMGVAGYDYSPRNNIIYLSDADYAGAYRSEYYMHIGENHEVVSDDIERHYQYFAPGTEPFDAASYSDTPYYFIDGVEVTEEEYMADSFHGDLLYIEGEYYYDQIVNFLTTETTPSYSTFVVVLADVTWEEAEQLCEEAGGHLATISDYTEYYLVTNAMRYCGNPYAILFVGAQNVNGTYVWTTDGSNAPIDVGNWRSGEPSYIGGTEDGRTVDESYVLIYTDNSQGYPDYLYMDVPNDIIDAAPTYSGNVGYVIEFEH